MTRQEANKKIVELILNQINEDANLKFNEILSLLKINKEKLDENLVISGLEDLYDEESTITLSRIQEQLQHLESLK